MNFLTESKFESREELSKHDSLAKLSKYVTINITGNLVEVGVFRRMEFWTEFELFSAW